jgi:Uma2 family endonuclease
MNAVNTHRRTLISAARYQKMIAAGVVTTEDRIELIEGEMLDMAPIGAKHAAIMSRLNEVMVIGTARRANVSCAGPVQLGELSQPQPDLMLLKRRTDAYEERIPGPDDVLLLVEISDSTMAFDQGKKLRLYAAHAIVEYWVIDVANRRMVCHREPSAQGYAQMREFKAGDSIASQAFPELIIAVQEILG